MKTFKITFSLFLFFIVHLMHGQRDFFLGGDLSYVNEMEDCGVIYQVNGQAEDPYKIFRDNGANIVRLRLWHTPSWLDTLNDGKRYSDLVDVKRSIRRARSNDMAILLDFHLSDTWADPSKQIVPAAWAPVVNNLSVLSDSLYDYIYETLMALDQEGLLPEMVQIGNETNKGILQRQAQNDAGWALDWPRNATLFNRGIKAVQDVEQSLGVEIKIVLHVADPSNAGWLLEGFDGNGVKDYDIIGLSYYWAWHKPTTIKETGAIIESLRQKYGKEVLIVETGYIWTNGSNDNANNIISEVHPDYSPASPENQRDWLIDLTKEVFAKEGLGVIYWEPAWVSSPCRTPWGQGSHQEHATFFDFENNVIENGGIAWLSYPYQETRTNIEDQLIQPMSLIVLPNAEQDSLTILYKGAQQISNVEVKVFDMNGRHLIADRIEQLKESQSVYTGRLASGTYNVSFFRGEKLLVTKTVFLK